MDDKILFLYAQCMTTRDICTVFKEFYDADVSASLISKVTNAVMEQVINKAIYLALGVNTEGHK